MLITIQLGRSIRIDIRTDRELLSRLSSLEETTDRLSEDLRIIDTQLECYVRSEDLIDQNLVEDYLAEADELRARLDSIDFWKADRYHKHKVPDET